MSDRLERLRAFVLATEGKEPVIGFDDCGPWVAQWIKQETGREIVFPIYRTREEAHLLIEAAGSLADFIAPLMRGFELTDDPQAGDVGVFFTGTKQMCGIVCALERHVVIRGEKGAASFIRHLGLIKAWRLP